MRVSCQTPTTLTSGSCLRWRGALQSPPRRPRHRPRRPRPQPGPGPSAHPAHTRPGPSHRRRGSETNQPPARRRSCQPRPARTQTTLHRGPRTRAPGLPHRRAAARGHDVRRRPLRHGQGTAPKIYANEFAGNALTPADEARARVDRGMNTIAMSTLFGVSLTAMSCRREALGERLRAGR